MTLRRGSHGRITFPQEAAVSPRRPGPLHVENEADLFLGEKSDALAGGGRSVENLIVYPN